MNKIKLLYDISKTMKEKDILNGTGQAECLKDQATVFQMDTSFSKNLATGLTKAAIRTEMNYDGKSFKHESSTEFTHSGDCLHHGHGLRGRHRHGEHSLPCGHEHSGLRGVFSMLALALDTLNRTEVEEQADQSILITLETDQLPKKVHERMAFRFQQDHGQEQEHGHFHKHCLMKEFHALENPNLTLTARVNRNNEIESIDLLLGGKNTDEAQASHDLELKAKITFSY